MKMRMLLLSLGKSKWTEDHKTSYLQFDSVLLEKIGHLTLFHATIFPILHTSIEKETKRAMKFKDLKMGGSKNGVPRYRWFICYRENPIGIDDLGAPIFGNTQMLRLQKDAVAAKENVLHRRCLPRLEPIKILQQSGPKYLL